MQKLNLSLRNISVVGGFTLISRVLGCVREILVASFLGASSLADAFALATKLPSMFRRLAADGALNIAFVPLFTQLRSDENLKRAYTFAGQVLLFLIFLLLFFVICVLILLKPALHILAPRFFTSPHQSEVLVMMCRITFPYIFFISLSAFYGSILNALNRFGPLAFAPVLGNVFLIACILIYQIFLPHLLMYGLAYGVVFSGVVQCAFVMREAQKCGVTLRPQTFKLSPLMRKFYKSFATAFLGAGMLHLNILISTFLALRLPYGTLACLSYADRLIQVPVSVLGAAVATTLLPTLSQQHARGRVVEAQETCCRALRLCLWLVLPCLLYIVVMRVQIVQVIYGRGKFDSLAVAKTAEAIVLFATALPAWMGIRVLNAHFFAEGSVRVTLWASLLNVVLDANLAFLLASVWAHQGIALAVSLAAWGQFMLLLVFTRSWKGVYRKFFGWNFWRRYLGMVVGLALGLLFSDWLSCSWGGWLEISVTLICMGGLFLVYVRGYNLIKELQN